VLKSQCKFSPSSLKADFFCYFENLKADCGLVSGKSIAQINSIEKAADGLFVRRIPAIARMLLFGRNLHFGGSVREREMRLSPRNCTRRERE
jgi:hypothetical protein